MTESKTAGCEMATPAVKSLKGTNQIVSKNSPKGGALKT
jgi:hypothetical protein